jgi:N-succinyldiaminopimelate aminotransferase
METIRGVQTFYSYCAPRPMQLAAASALEQGDSWLAQMRETYGRAAKLAASALEQPTPAGGTFLFFDISPFMKRGDTPDDVLERCANAGVMLTPGGACGAAYTTWARMCFTTVPEAELERACELLREVFFG